jgi:ubiquinol-cytochrome c reductase cytochrome b subunit
MAAELEIQKPTIRDWISINTEFDAIASRLVDAPSSGFSAWARTTGGVVALLIFLQFFTGILLAFQYVPTADNAYTTVAYIEQAINAGTWVRSLHYHSSVLLPLALLAHLAQMIFRNSFVKNTTAWAFAIIFLALVLAAGATGYALPWDARAFNGVSIAVSLAGNTPLVGAYLQNWLQNGNAISTLTLSRFYGLHVFIVPFLILSAVIARLFIFGGNKKSFDLSTYKNWFRSQLVRNAMVIGLIFVALAAFSFKFAAPFGPTVQEAGSFLPRPGPQFLWLFEMQKYTNGKLAAMLAFGFPGLIIGSLLIIPFFKRRISNFKSIRIVLAATFIVGIGTVGILTALAKYQDASDLKISNQLAEQEKAEAEFRAKAFKPKTIRTGDQPKDNEAKSAAKEESVVPDQTAAVEMPTTYKTNCAKCHGDGGEGTKKFPELIGVTTREEDKLSDENLIDIMNDPAAYGLSSKMPAFRDKLTEDEKREIVRYIKSLK